MAAIDAASEPEPETETMSEVEKRYKECMKALNIDSLVSVRSPRKSVSDMLPSIAARNRAQSGSHAWCASSTRTSTHMNFNSSIQSIFQDRIPKIDIERFQLNWIT